MSGVIPILDPAGVRRYSVTSDVPVDIQALSYSNVDLSGQFVCSALPIASPRQGVPIVVGSLVEPVGVAPFVLAVV